MGNYTYFGDEELYIVSWRVYIVVNVFCESLSPQFVNQADNFWLIAQDAWFSKTQF